jgi:hypothetical protein
MSDPVTNVNIDDVLSSIRRLVTEGERPDARSVPGQGATDRLVLTPDHRVNVPDDGGTHAKSAPDADPVARALADDHSLENLLILQAEQSVAADQPAEPIAEETLAATIAAVESRVRGRDDEWEPDEGDDMGHATKATWTSEGFVAGRRDKTVSDPPLAPSLEEEVAASMVNEAFKPRPRSAAEAPLVLEERAFARQAQPTPTTAQVKRASVPARDEDDTDYGDELAQTRSFGNDETLDQYLNQAPQIDEALLRQLVKEVVREELQGNLGERITRNVRKLVRREIHNILTTQEFN